MCLAVPGRVESVFDESGTVMAQVDFGGVRRRCHAAYLLRRRTWVSTSSCVGFAIQRLDESAKETLATFERLGIPRGGVRRRFQGKRPPGEGGVE
ncbi:MAG: HypC/HybG/HupF family hydrogenase formation chaperone [Nocardioides sp.]